MDSARVDWWKLEVVRGGCTQRRRVMCYGGWLGGDHGESGWLRMTAVAGGDRARRRQWPREVGCVGVGLGKGCLGLRGGGRGGRRRGGGARGGRLWVEVLTEGSTT